MLALMHVDLIVRNMEASLAFYRALGCTVVEDAVVQGAAVEFYSKGTADSMRLVMLRPAASAEFGAMVELMEFRSETGALFPLHRGEEHGSPTIRNLAFVVDDIDESLARLKTSGIEPVSRMFRIELPVGGKNRIVFLHDPDANLVELVDEKVGRRGP